MLVLSKLSVTYLSLFLFSSHQCVSIIILIVWSFIHKPVEEEKGEGGFIVSGDEKNMELLQIFDVH